MAEIEYGGVKLGGSKLLLIVPLIGTIIGGLWGGFEGKFAIIDRGINLVKDEITSIKEDSEKLYVTIKDLKQSVRDDIDRQEKIIDQVEDDIAAIEADVRSTIDIAEGRFESKRDQLQQDYEQKSDTIRVDVERKLTDLETRLNTKLQQSLDNPLAN